ncbi:hypothetical protein RGU72_15235 [Undibacterium sp. 5I1]|uniref:hypothetical protein n=1 Tax=unclassified Undibacterium TaxID=2630295 RepID=UPI002AB5BF42|nr:MULTISPECIES: hypothetical protein [unclassified Undibacterium]MDY7539605.1 hypothetical protein [Undibacterium sp. 5I1]MEB0230444.1 hypothetical protein [Undibacterium sp. 10I3]MEB0258494.1 hypothetical protein [Undibacterium sp. 5I1]
MPMLELTNEELIIHLNFWEKIASFQKNVRVRLEHVRGATDDDGFRGMNLGMRAPGTGFPGLIQAGTYRKGGDTQFVFWTRGTHCVVIELDHDKWSRIILGVKDARKFAHEINVAVNNNRNK